MIEGIYIEDSVRGSAIHLQHSTGQTTVVRFGSIFPIQAKECYFEALKALLKKHPDLSPDDDLLSLFIWWFARYNLEIPLSVGTFTNKDRERIGERIRELRKELHMDAKHLSMASGVNPANICRIEQGKCSVGLDVLSRIASVLGCKVDLVKTDNKKK